MRMIWTCANLDEILKNLTRIFISPNCPSFNFQSKNVMYIATRQKCLTWYCEYLGLLQKLASISQSASPSSHLIQ
jgi:hypothetical protein